MKNKELFVTDLDGTFLNKKAQVTEKSRGLVNRFIEKGGYFTFATARTASSAVMILDGVNVNVPCILMNGVSIYDIQRKCYIKNEYFSHSEAVRITEIFKESGVIPFMYRIDGGTLETYYYGFQCHEMEEFFNMRDSLPGRPFIKCDSLSRAADDKVVYFSVQGKQEDLQRTSDLLRKEDIAGHAFYRDVYNTGIWFLEVFSRNASKSNGVRFVKEYGGFDKVTCFGDNLNDLPMFEVSDRRIAVANAKEEVRSAADEMIGDNESDSVAEWLGKISPYQDQTHD